MSITLRLNSRSRSEDQKLEIEGRARALSPTALIVWQESTSPRILLEISPDPVIQTIGSGGTMIPWAGAISDSIDRQWRRALHR